MTGRKPLKIAGANAVVDEFDGLLDDVKPKSPDDLPERATDAAMSWKSREPAPAVQPEYAQLGLRTDRADVEKFKRLAYEGNWTQPQLLRRMMRAYEAYGDKDELGR